MPTRRWPNSEAGPQRGSTPAREAAHLDDEDLVGVDLDDVSQAHLAGCPWCRVRRDAFSPEERDELHALLAQVDEQVVPSSTLEAAAGFALPERLHSALIADESTFPDVAPAQLWRLSWDGQDALAVVLERTSWWVRVAPVNTDVTLADEYCFVAGDSCTTLDTATAVFLRAATTVPMFTLAQFLGDVSADDGGSAATALHDLEAALLNQTAPGAGSRTGIRLQADDWDRLAELDALREQMQWFASASRDVFDGAHLTFGGADAVAASADAVDVVKLLNNSSEGLGELAAATGLAPVRLHHLKNGKAVPTAQDRVALEHHFHVSVKAAHSPEERLTLLEIASEPTHRRQWRRWSEGETTHAESAESIAPFLNHLLEQAVAARSVPGPAPASQESVLENWRRHWRSRLALRGLQDVDVDVLQVDGTDE